MKTTILTSLLAVLLVATNVYAQGTEKKVLTNIETTEWGNIKELIYFNDDASAADRKTAYHYDKNDILLKKVNYKWDGMKGWIPVQKYEYEYGNKGKVANVIFTKWDTGKKRWAEQSERMAHVHSNSNDNKLIAKGASSLKNVSVFLLKTE